MLSNSYIVNFPETLNLTLAGSAVHFSGLTQQTTILTVALVLNGTTVNSAATVVVDIAVDGVVHFSIGLPNGATAGTAGAINFSFLPAVIPAGAIVSATVSVPATVAAGSGSVTLSLENG